MPIRLSDLRKERRAVTFEFLGESVRAEYCPGAVTPQMEARAFEIDAGGRYLSGLAELLSEIVVGWDVLGEDGQPMSVTRDVLRQLSADFLAALWAAITSDQRAPKAPGGSLGAI